MAKKVRKKCVLKQGCLSIPSGTINNIVILKNGVIKLSKDSYLIRKADNKGGYII